MKPIRTFFARKSPLKQLADYLAEGEKPLTKLNEGIARLREHEAQINASFDRYLEAPTPENCDALLVLVSQREATHAVIARVTGTITDRREALFAGSRGQELLRAAFENVRAALEEQRQAIVADDARRSEKLGMQLSDSAALDRVDQLLEKLDQGSAFIRVNPQSAYGTLRNLTGES